MVIITTAMAIITTGMAIITTGMAIITTGMAIITTIIAGGITVGVTAAGGKPKCLPPSDRPLTVWARSP
jgi:hypothetical protein